MLKSAIIITRIFKNNAMHLLNLFLLVFYIAKSHCIISEGLFEEGFS